MSKEKPTTGELAIMIANLTENITSLTKTMAEGFQGIHLRQDTTNGKVLKNDEFRLTNSELLDTLREERKAEKKRYGDILWKIGSVAVAAALGLKQFWN